MKHTKTYIAWAVVVTVAVAILIGAVQAFAATSFAGGTLLQIGDVKSTHILNGTILDIDVSNSAVISATKVAPRGIQGSVLLSNGTTIASTTALKFATTTSDLYCFSCRIHATSTNFNGVNYTWPSADGSSGYALLTNGTGTLSWTAASPAYLLQSFPAAEAISAGDAVYVKSYQSGGAMTIDTSATGETTGASVSTSITVASNSNRAMLCAVGLKNNVSPTNVQYAGVAMTLLDLRQDQTGSRRTHAYYLLAPTTGANNFTFTNNDAYAAWACYSLYNVSQSLTPAVTTYAPSQGIFSQSTTTIAAGYDIFTFLDSAGISGAPYVNINNRLLQDNAADTYFLAGNTTPATASVSTTTSQANNVGWHAAIHVQVAPANAFVGGVGRADADTAAFTTPFIGFAQSAISQNATGNVFVDGIASGFSNLIVGTQYYVSNTTGGISSTAGTNTRKACIAVGTTSCLITNVW
ncbi:hypothetical protein EPO14_01110 [Patescibacteria group bacterium]|nr:MAG: hypothetical protein EPO14_01110 [Patescibacteria group bacterium]